MNLREVASLARAEGARIRFADLGEFDGCEIRAEYDPRQSAIRLNARLLRKIQPAKLAAYLALAVAHELYHHREHVGRVPLLRSRRAREEAAEEFAHALLARSA